MLRGTSTISPRESPSTNMGGFCAAPELDLSQACPSTQPNPVAPEVRLEGFQAIRIPGETDCPGNPGPRPAVKRRGAAASEIRRLAQQDTWGRYHLDVKTVFGRFHKNPSRGSAWANRLCPDP